MAEEQQVTTKEPQQVTKEPQQVQREPQQVTTKNPKKVEAGKRLAAHNCRQTERERKARASTEVSQYYDIGAVLAVGLIGGFCYYLYQAKKGEVSPQQPSHPEPPQQPPRPQSNKFEMD